MTTLKRILLCALIFALVIAFVPLWGRLHVVPCHHMWRWAISYEPPGMLTILPDDAFPRHPPLCFEFIRPYSNVL